VDWIGAGSACCLGGALEDLGGLVGSLTSGKVLVGPTGPFRCAVKSSYSLIKLV